MFLEILCLIWTEKHGSERAKEHFESENAEDQLNLWVFKRDILESVLIYCDCCMCGQVVQLLNLICLTGGSGEFTKPTAAVS